jgi:hypothetical protein
MTTEDRLGWTLAFILVFFVMGLISYGVFSKKYTKQYSLSASGNGLAIEREIENATDVKIPLINVSYERAIALVDSLNKTLPKDN